MMRWLYKKTAFMICILILIPLLFGNASTAFAEEATAESTHEIVLVLDASSSMKDNDSGYLAPDALQQLCESLPLRWKTGLVIYNGVVVESSSVTDQPQVFYDNLSHIKYSGHTNTGAAIGQALTMFSENAVSRHILLLTDGEIAMQNDIQTQEAADRMDAALQSAVDSGVKIHTIGLGSGFQSYENSVKRCSEMTGGRLLEVQSTSGLHDAVNQLVFETLQVKYISIGSARMSGNNSVYNAKLPVSGITQAKVLITSESPVSDISVSCEESEIKDITTGKRFASVTIREPAGQDISVSYTSSGSSSAWMILDYNDLQLLTEVTYDDIEILDASAERDSPEARYIERTAQIKIELVGQNGDKLLQNSSFADMSFPVQINGEAAELSAKDGYLSYEMPVTESGTVAIAVSVNGLPLNISQSELQAEISLEAPPPVEPEPEHISLWALFGTLALLILAIILLILFFRKREKKQKPQETPPLFDSKFEFTGKVNIYITKTKDEEDIPPLTFDLFRLNKKREISVMDMMQKCDIQSFPGTEKIIFVAGRNGALQIVNDSDCTILIGRDILIKKRSHLLEYGEKIHITCEDDTEMELHYKSVKPSEKNTVSNTSISYSN